MHRAACHVALCSTTARTTATTAVASTIRFVGIFSKKQLQQRQWRSSSSASSSSSFPVGIFIDLDNVTPTTFSRQDAKDLVDPLRQFAESITTTTKAATAAGGKQQDDGSAVAVSTAIYGFANRPTQTYVPAEERSREFDQNWCGGGGGSGGNDSLNITGYDEKGFLRCGVCGTKMKLTNKDKKKGWEMEDKLDQHMKMLHDKEQAKRKTRRKQGKLNEKDLQKLRKYESATIGLHQLGIQRRGNSNDLFAVLKEQGVKCSSAEDVDTILERTALKWMTRVCSERGIKTTGTLLGCLMVVSGDSDFVPLLTRAKQKHFLAVSVAPSNTEQTKKLVRVSDIVLKRKGEETSDLPCFGPLLMQACSSVGKEILLEMKGEGVDHEGNLRVESGGHYQDFDDVLLAFYDDIESRRDNDDENGHDSDLQESNFNDSNSDVDNNEDFFAITSDDEMKSEANSNLESRVAYDNYFNDR